MHRDALDADTRGAVQRLAAVSDAERHRVRGLERAVQDNVTEARFQAALLLKGNASDLSFAVRKLQAALLTVKERSYSKQEVRDLVKQATVAAAAGRGLPAELARAHDAADVKPESLQLGVFAGDWDVDERGDDDERAPASLETRRPVGAAVPDEVRKWMERTDSHLSTCERALQQHGDRLAGSKHEQRVTDDRLDAAESRIHSVAEQAVQLIASEHRRLLQLERDVSVLSDKLEHAVDDHAFLKAQLDRQHREHSVQIDEILNTLERHRILDAAKRRVSFKIARGTPGLGR
ncbi:hypothetical protein M885DRAFT_451880 [Pelagophyceae sp. CCMP2097]|nr:hypothetical protein M885DRAFT_451880 [Pelagophyceae sp. CCMP2097]